MIGGRLRYWAGQMRIFKIPGLVLIFGGLFLGLVQLINMMAGQAQDLSLHGILQKLDPNGGSAMRNMLPGAFAQEMFDGLLRAPAWAASLAFGIILFLTARRFGDDD